MVTWTQLGAVIAAIAGVILCLAGATAIMAGSMSDDPEQGQSAGTAGCILVAIGAATLILVFVRVGHALVLKGWL